MKNIKIHGQHEMDVFLANWGVNSEDARRKIIHTAQIIEENIMRHIERLDIGKTGNLKRSIHWKIFNAAGGNEILIRFYTQNIANFVELATQRRAHATFIQPVKGKNYDAQHRTDDNGKPMKRRAKPFIANEIRLHMRILQNMLVKEFAYMGHATLIAGLTPKNDKYVSAGQKKSLFGARWEVDELKRFGYKLVGESK